MAKISKTVTADKLKEILWHTMQAVQAGEISTSKANSICSGARTICATVKLEIEMAKLTGQKGTTSAKKFISSKGK